MKLNVEKLIASAEECLGWPYVSPGTNDQNGIDCSGLFVKAFRDQGAYIYHGSNSIYRKSCTEKGKITSVNQLVPGMAVFKHNTQDTEKFPDGLGDFYHIGMVTSVNPLVITHATSPVVKQDTKLGKWTYYGKLKNVDYDGKSGEKEVVVVIEYAKVKGGTLNLREGKGTNYPRIAQIPNETTVAVIEHGEEWCKVTYNDFTGYVMTKFLSFGDEKESKLMISISRETAMDLYEALKYSLKL